MMLSCRQFTMLNVTMLIFLHLNNFGSGLTSVVDFSNTQAIFSNLSRMCPLFILVKGDVVWTYGLNYLW